MSSEEGKYCLNVKNETYQGAEKIFRKKKMVVFGETPKVIVKALKWMTKKLGPTNSVDFIFNKWLKKG